MRRSAGNGQNGILERMSVSLLVQRTVAILFAFALLLTCLPLPASAHTLKTDGTIEGVLHLSPGHLPTAGEQASFRFILKDTVGKFRAENYTLTLSVSDTNGAAEEVPLSVSGMTAKAPYVFPHEGDYVATLSGSSTVPGIPSFRLAYNDISALPAGEHQGFFAEFFGEHGGHALVTGLIALVFVSVVVWEKVEERRRKKGGLKNP